jgi:hypothetical protein
VDDASLEESNSRTNEHINRINELTDISLGELNDLISYIKKVNVWSSKYANWFSNHCEISFMTFSIAFSILMLPVLLSSGFKFLIYL